MAIHVFCSRASNGAKELTEALGASRLRSFDGMDFWRKRHKVKVKEGDLIVCWGESLPEIEDVKVLNSSTRGMSKHQEATLLKLGKVPTISTYNAWPKGAPVPDTILGRKNNHVGGADLLAKVGVPDYYVVKEPLVKEYRIHSFAEKSIRAGIKIPREGFKPLSPEAAAALTKSGLSWQAFLGKNKGDLVHPWIRSFDAGWRISYDGFKSNKAMREIANKAVKTLGLTFGAVDIGEKADGSLLVLEVNRGPGIEGNSIEVYAKAIQDWASGDIPEPKVKAKKAGVVPPEGGPF